MSAICTRTRLNAKPGRYEVAVSSTDSNVTVHGFHAVNGTIIERWEHSDLYNKAVPIEVNADEKHGIDIIATLFSETTVTVSLSLNGQALGRSCILKPDGPTSAAIGIVA
ncbi:MAG: hypothetical protein ACREQZ_09440 [Woeseiaceae bacterium]